jgi:hypothetical protein
MNPGERLSEGVQSLVDQIRQDQDLWWGRTAEDGWLVLDRSDPFNRDDETRRLVRCRDWQQVQVGRQDFGSDRFRWFVNHVRSLPDRRQQEECLAELVQLRAEFLSRRSHLRLMTEGEWQTASVPYLLAYASRLPGCGDSGFRVDAGRKHLLLACAIARLYWHALVARLRKAIPILEAAPDDLTKKRTDPPAVEPNSLEDWIVDSLRAAGDWPKRRTSMADLWTLFIGGWRDMTDPSRPKPFPPYEGWAPLIHDVFGNPFSPAAFDPVWRTPVVGSLARAAYEERSLPAGALDPGRLAVLADSLEEAGCSDGTVLSHLRGPGPHIRGCWALDLVLGKTDPLPPAATDQESRGDVDPGTRP